MVTPGTRTVLEGISPKRSMSAWSSNIVTTAASTAEAGCGRRSIANCLTNSEGTSGSVTGTSGTHCTLPPAHHSRLLQAASATRLGLRSCSWPRTRTKSAASTNAEPVPGTKRRAQRVPLSVGKLPDQQPAPEFSGGDVAEVLYPGLEASEPLVPREGWILDSAVGCERHRAACGSASAWRSSAG